MCKKSLLMMLLLALLVPWAANAQTVTIGEGTSTQNSAPIANYYNYSMAEIIYTADEIAAGNPTVNTITQIGFQCTSNVSKSYGITVYMKNIAADAFTATSDFITLSNADVVFTGTVSPTSGWTVIELPQVFTYDNTSNLLIAVNKTSGGYAGSTAIWNYTSTSSTYRMLYSQSDYNTYDPTSALSLSMNYNRPNVQITFAAPASCIKPFDLVCTGTTPSTADLTWVAGDAETDWVLEYGTAADFTGATQVNVSGTPAYTLTGLPEATTYYARVKADCGGGDQSDWANQTVTFVTKQTAVAVGNGWSDDFEGSNNWLMFNGGNNAWYIGSNIDTTNVSNILFVSNDGGVTNAYTNSALNIVYATKFMTFENAQYTFDFDWRAYGEGSWDYIRAFLIPGTQDIIVNQIPDGITSTSTFSTSTPQGWIDFGGGKLNLFTAWQTASETVNVTAGDYYVAFMWVNDGSAGTNPPAAIDNFSITKVTCPTPANFVASDVTAHTAILSWEGLDAEAWQYVLTDDAEANPDDLTAYDLTVTSFDLVNLPAETHFYAYVRTVCGQDYTEWVSTDFTTLVACPAPTGLAVTLTFADGTVATLDWTENGTATDWDVEYGTDPEFGNFTVVNVAGTPSTQLTGLTPETTYYARVKTYCGGEDGYSTYSNIVTFTPTDALTLTVNDGTATNSYVPVYGLYVDEVSKSQFIIPAESISDLSNYVIDKLTFYASQQTVDWGDAEFEVYFAEVDYTTFSAATLVDWSSMTNVMSGSLGISGNQMVVELETPYIYNGGNLLIGVLETTSGTYKSSSWYGVSQSAYTAIGGYESSKALNLYQFLPKVTFDVSEVPSCFRPNSLAVDGITARTANLTWVAGAEETAWQVCINGDETNLIDVTRTAYAMEGLTPGTTYTVKVRSNCGEGDFSDWTNEVSFTTEPSCYAPTDLTASDLSFVSANISWTSENENIEMHYRVLTDPNNDFEASSLKNWKSIDADGDGYGWVVGAESPGIYHNTTAVLTGNGHNGSFDFVISGSYSNVTGLALTPDNYLVSPQINLGGSITFWAQAQDASYPYEHFGVAVSTTGNAASDFTTIQEWTMTAKGTGAKANSGTTRSGNRVTGNWYEYTVDLSDYAGETGYVAIRHFDCTDQFLLNVDDITVVQPNYVEPEWIDVANVTNPYTLSGLQSATCYEIEVRANCGTEDGYSAWTWAWFLTPSACAAPVELNSIPLVTSATLEWQEAYEDFQQASYNVHYREAAVGWEQVGSDETATGTWAQYTFDLSDYAGQQGYVALRHYNVTDQYWLLVDDITYGGTTYNFDDGELPTGWTLYNHDGDGYNWEVYDLTFGEDSTYAYSGNYGLISASYVNNVGALTPDNWVILPYGDLSGTLTLYAKGLDADYAAEVFGVFVFTEEELSFENNNPWIEVSGITDFSTVLENLDPTTSYEWQVQGVNRDCNGGVTDWSEIATFTTHDYCDDPDIESFEFETLEATTATLTWVGYQDSYNVAYKINDDFFFDDFSSGNLYNWTYDNLASTYVYTVTDDGLKGYVFWYDENYIPQTLISDEMYPVPAGTQLSFYYAAASDCSIKVGYSSTDNDLESFTWSEPFAIEASSYFAEYSEEVPEGTKYFAVQYLTGEENGYLIVTYFDVYIELEDNDYIEMVVDESTATLEPLLPNTQYRVYVQGICGEGEDEVTGWVGGVFMTPAPSTVTQTVALSEGWNWWSTYIDGEDMLNQLKASLGTVGVSVKTQGASMIYRGGRWMGSVPMENSRGYQIMVNAPVELTMEGQIVDPSTCPITILPGANWIGYPLTESKTVAAALAGTGFTPTSGDAISTQGGSAMYRSGRWMPASFTLEPGKGYLYKSNATENGTIVFSNGKKLMSQGNQLTPKVKKDTVNAIENVSTISKLNKHKVSFKIK